MRTPDTWIERAPVGLGLFDPEARFLHVNDRLAEINGVPAAGHVGRPIEEVLPDLPAEVAADIRRVAQTGRPLTEVEISGETPARQGVRRQWLASYWPVRADGAAEVTGIGCVVLDVTDRRAAGRALRTQTDRYETLLLALSELGEGMVVVEDGRCVYANPAFEQLSGYPLPELRAMDSLFDLIVEADREEARRRTTLRVEAGLVDPGFALAMRRRDGALLRLEVAGVPLAVEDRAQLVVVVRDVTARHRAEAERERLLRRSALLAEASELFDESLDEERTMRSVARLSVRDLADSCVIVLGRGPGSIRRVAAVARDPERERALTELQARDPLQDRTEHPLLDVLRSGRASVIAGLPELGGLPSVAVALCARGRIHGVLAAGFERLQDGEEAELIALLEDLGRRAALALDNARLYEERSAVARTLQRSLVPPDLPAVPGMQVAARYRAAGEGNEVGGDFYDCFSTGGGDWALVIGDVCGKGAEAAAITALARYTVRAAVLHSRRPRTVLEELNEALLRQDLGYRFCTVLYASLTPRAGRVAVTTATGGHPLPLVLRASGQVERAGRPGSLLGVLDAPVISEEPLELDPGDTLVLYTDGVIEASPVDDAFGPDRLEAFLADLAGADAVHIAESIERKVLAIQGGFPRDDVAVVVARVEPDLEASFAAAGQGVAALS